MNCVPVAHSGDELSPVAFRYGDRLGYRDAIVELAGGRAESQEVPVEFTDHRNAANAFVDGRLNGYRRALEHNGHLRPIMSMESNTPFKPNYLDIVFTAIALATALALSGC